MAYVTTNLLPHSMNNSNWKTFMSRGWQDSKEGSDLDGAPLPEEDVDGLPMVGGAMDVSTEGTKEELDGAPLGEEDVDGMPLGGDMDGEPCEWRAGQLVTVFSSTL